MINKYKYALKSNKPLFLDILIVQIHYTIDFSFTGLLGSTSYMSKWMLQKDLIKQLIAKTVGW